MPSVLFAFSVTAVMGCTAVVDDCYREITLLSHPPIRASLLEKVQVRESQPRAAPVHQSVSALTIYTFSRSGFHLGFYFSFIFPNTSS